MSTKGYVRFFKFCLEFKFYAKIKKGLVLTHLQKPSLSIIQDLNKKTKKNPASFFRHWQDEKVCKMSTKKILNCTVVGACQSFQFFRQITWFLGNIRTLPKFKY